MSDKPILFSAPMIRALPDGRKTQTRRILNPQPHAQFISAEISAERLTFCPALLFETPTHKMLRRLARPGDRLWVREAWKTAAAYDDLRPSQMGGEEPIQYQADGAHQTWGYPAISKIGRLRPGIFMPRWASRLTLIVTDVRVQRLQEINDEDARAEGMTPLPSGRFHCGHDEEGEITCKSPVTAFAWLWNSINGEDAWQRNDWVAVYTFTVHRCNIDALTHANAEPAP